MGIEAIFLGVALVCVALTRGSYKQLIRTRFNHWWTLVVVLAGQLVMTFGHIAHARYNSIGLAVLLATYVFLFGFCVANINLRGMWIVLIGLASNAVVIGLNKGMPVTTSGGYVVKETIKHQPANSADLLPWLSDVIPLNALNIAISAGDIIFGLGLIYVCVAASRKEKTASTPETELIAIDFEMIDVVEGIALEDPLADDELDVFIDLTAHAQVVPEETEPVVEKELIDATPIMKSSHGPGAPRSNKNQELKAERIAHKRSHKKWQRTHGLAALPTKEALGFDDESMEIVDIAQ